MFNRFFRRFSRKPLTQKTYEAWAAKGYCSSPLISFIIQSHNRSKQVVALVHKLRGFTAGEIIVIDDGSSTNHTITIANLLIGANEFLLRCNDLYEVITYDRAINLAKGTYVILLQDDDDFDGLSWVEEGLTFFGRDDRLVILGGRDGGTLLPYDVDDEGLRGPYEHVGNVAARKNSFKIRLQEANQPVPGMIYSQYVDRAPMWIRRKPFLNILAGIDTAFAPFQWDDAELCLRAWLSGLHVGLYAAKFKLGGLGLGGMQIWNRELHHRQDEVNAGLLYQKYGTQLAYIDLLVDQCNQLSSAQIEG